METKWTEMILAAMVAALIILMEHYWIPDRLPLTARYALGVLAIYLPLSGLLAIWQAWWALGAIWLAAISAGMATLLSYAIDAWRLAAARAAISEHEADTLKQRSLAALRMPKRQEVGDGPSDGRI